MKRLNVEGYELRGDLYYDARADMWLSVEDGVAKVGYDPKFGARPLRRAIQRYVEDPLSEALLSGVVKGGQRVKGELADDKIVFAPLSEVDAVTPTAES